MMNLLVLFRNPIVLAVVLCLQPTYGLSNRKPDCLVCQYEFNSVQFEDYIVTNCKNMRTKTCYIHVSGYFNDKSLIVVNYLQDDIAYYVPLSFGVITKDGVIIVLSGNRDCKLFKKKRTHLSLCEAGLLEEINDGVLEAFVYDGEDIFLQDWQNNKLVPLKALMNRE